MQPSDIVQTHAAATVVADAAALAERAADYFIATVGAALAARGQASVALAGGSTPRAMNALLAAAPRRDALDWTKISFYFGDERCVPPDHPDSNYRMTRETLFAPLAIGEARVYRVRGEDEPHVAADTYDAVIRETLGTPPAFDLITLGMGPDGHTASLFPGTISTLDDRRVACANFVAKFDAFRITITPQVIDAARQVMVTVAGSEKAAALAAVLAGPYDPDRYPAQLVGRSNPNVRWFIDEAAAGR